MAKQTKKFDAQGAITQTIDIAVKAVSASQQAKKQLELQEKLGRLSLKQKKLLESRLQDVQSDIERMRIMYQTFAVMENDKLISETTNRKLTLFYFLGGGALLLVGMAIVFKNRK